jgi:hypothetical protein
MRGRVRFHWLTGDVNFLSYGGKWISNKQSNGEFDYWFVLEIINWEDAVGEREAKERGHRYIVELRVVAPSEVPEEHRKAAVKSCWNDTYSLNLDAISSENMVEILDTYGISAPVFSIEGNNARKLLRRAREEANVMEAFSFGFVMDRPCNAIGSTGWDFIKGDILAGLRRLPNTPEKAIIQKMEAASQTSEEVANDS